MNIAVLGAASFAGARLAALLRASGWARALLVREHDRDAADCLREADAVVDCTPNPRPSPARDAACRQACSGPGHARLIVLGSTQVYGGLEGRVRESVPLGGPATAATRAWRMKEAAARQCARDGGQVVLLRAGPLWGAGHPAIGAMARLLRERRLGDLGEHGDGWSNLLSVDDACLAVLRALQLTMAAGELRCYNLAAPDSPRWNEMFVELALALGVTPVPRIAGWRVAAARWLRAPVLDGAKALGFMDASRSPGLPHGGPGAWKRQQRIDATLASVDLRLDWSPHAVVLAEAAAWEERQEGLGRLRSPAPEHRRRQHAAPGP